MSGQSHIRNLVVIGGSMGSFPVLLALFASLPQEYSATVIVVVHRPKNVKSQLEQMLCPDGRLKEPDDKEIMQPGGFYLAPQNYHLLVEPDGTIALDTAETINYSRPSIDATFLSAATAFGTRVTGVLLSGANKDGVEGLGAIISHGGRALVQDPATAMSAIMPGAAIEKLDGIEVYAPEEIITALIKSDIEYKNGKTE